MQPSVLLILAIMATLTLVMGMPLHNDQSANLEGPDPVAEDIDFYEDDSAHELNTRGGCGHGYKFCGVSTACDLP